MGRMGRRPVGGEDGEEVSGVGRMGRREVGWGGGQWVVRMGRGGGIMSSAANKEVPCVIFSMSSRRVIFSSSDSSMSSRFLT